MEQRLIDANALMDSFRAYMAERYDKEKCVSVENCNTCDEKCLWWRIVRIEPIVNAVEVVRCKDCEHHRQRNEYEQAYLAEGVLICTSSEATDDCWNPVWPNHFCACGERRDSDG